MKTPLLTKGTSFQQNYQHVVLRIQSIKKKNDQYQRLSVSQIDSAMAQQIIQQKSILDRQIDQTKNLIEEMEKVFKQLPQKNKLKQIKKDYEKQLNRYKQISQSLMQKSVIKAQMRNSYRKSLPDKNNQAQARTRQVGPPPRQSLEHIAQQQQLDIDYTLEHNILMERKQELGKVQQHMQRVYQIHQDQANMVNQQGNMVDIIGQQMLKAQDNVQAANEQLIQAKIQQKKSRKKCYILIFIVLLVIMLLGGAYFILGPG